MMRSFLKKVWSAFAVAVLAASAIQADTAFDQYEDALDNASYCARRPEPCYGYAYNPGVFIGDCCGWYANIEFLYWKPNQEGISFGTLSQLTSQSSNVGATAFGRDFYGTLNSQQLYPRFEWDSGFRFGLGYHLPDDSWSVGLVFTHYNTDTDLKTGSGFSDVSGIIGTLYAPAFSAYFDTDSVYDRTQVLVDTAWKIQFNQLDLDFGREFYVARSMTVRPHAGLRALFINQTYDIIMAASGFTDGAGINSSSAVKEVVYMKNDFKGLGLQGGLDLTFEIGCGLSFYSELTGSATFGHFRTRQKSTGSNQFGATGSFTSVQTSLRNYDDHDTLLPNADLAFGLLWRQKVNCDENTLSIKFGWEEHLFFGYNRLRSLVAPANEGIANNTPSGNLDFYGIVVAAAIDF